MQFEIDETDPVFHLLNEIHHQRENKGYTPESDQRYKEGQLVHNAEVILDYINRSPLARDSFGIIQKHGDNHPKLLIIAASLLMAEYIRRDDISQKEQEKQAFEQEKEKVLGQTLKRAVVARLSSFNPYLILLKDTDPGLLNIHRCRYGWALGFSDLTSPHFPTDAEAVESLNKATSKANPAVTMMNPVVTVKLHDVTGYIDAKFAELEERSASKLFHAHWKNKVTGEAGNTHAVTLLDAEHHLQAFEKTFAVGSEGKFSFWIQPVKEKKKKQATMRAGKSLADLLNEGIIPSVPQWVQDLATNNPNIEVTFIGTGVITPEGVSFDFESERAAKATPAPETAPKPEAEVTPPEKFLIMTDNQPRYLSWLEFNHQTATDAPNIRRVYNIRGWDTRACKMIVLDRTPSPWIQECIDYWTAKGGTVDFHYKVD